MVKLKLLAILLFVAAVGAVLLFGNNGALNRSVHAFSSGPPAGYTRAPGEEPEACAECHVVESAGTGQLTLNVPQTYVPGQTYDITVTHANTDPTRMRWGFQLTALDGSEEKAGTLAPLDSLTQVLEGQGPFPERQYIEHTSQGTFFGQQNGASWTFRWTAPADDVGPVTFYAAGNQANGDGNTSGDNIYFTFVASTFSPPTPGFSVSVSPASRLTTPGGSAQYNVTVTPTAGFTGDVTLAASNLPANTGASFSPSVVSITDANAKTSVLTLTTTAATPLGAFQFNVSATSGALQHSAPATVVVADPASADLSLTITDSPDPADTATPVSYRVEVTNNGPAAATNVNVSDTLPAGATFVSATPSQGTCAGTTDVTCSLGDLAAGATASVTVVVQPQSAGTVNNTATATATQTDPIPSNNTATAATTVLTPSSGPSMLVSNLGVRTVIAGLSQPTSMAFIGPDDFLVLEKETGRVKRVRNGALQGVVLDLAVNSASERGLLGLALHPNFASNGFVYLYWTESSTGADTTAIDAVPLLGNRIDRFTWDGSVLDPQPLNIVRLRALQQDAGQPSRGNHDGGVLRFGPDGKLYVVVGDLGRRGLLQNITSGGPVPDDQFGGPEPDNAHLSGVILRLNDDGTTPADNPFFNAPTSLTGEAALNVKKIFAYGVRNSFGMDFDPLGGALWTQENGDDSFDEINRVTAGFNGGWIQLMGPSSRVAEFKQIETARSGGLQQVRWPPSLIADTPQAALARLFQLPGSAYAEPAFSWKYAVAPSPVGFARGDGLGAQYANDLFVGASRTTLLGGYLFRFELSDDRASIATTDSRLFDRVADNADKFDLAESESLAVGRDFGITTDIRTGPDGKLYVVSLSNGAVYQIFSRPTLFTASLTGTQETPPNNSEAYGTATLLLSADETTALVSVRFEGLATPQTDAHIHVAPGGQSGPPVFDLPDGEFTDFKITLTPQQVAQLQSGLFYINLHTTAFPAGEIRGQFLFTGVSSIVRFDIADASVSEGAGAKTVNVIRLGDTDVPAAIFYETSDGAASERSDYTTARGTLRFAAGETSKSFDVLVTDDAFQEGNETIGLSLSSAEGGDSFADPPTASLTIIDNDAAPPSANPIDDTAFFVRQHYHDFLNREPDTLGLQFWSNDIDSCGADAQCREAKRVNVSAAFFLSIEFQETGFLAYRLYETAFDRQPRYAEFVADTREIGEGVVVGQGDWQQRLEQNKQEFLTRFIQRLVFRHDFDSLTNAQYVDRLFANAGVAPNAAERDALVGGLNSGTETRATVLRKVADNAQLRALELNRAFVLMQYFGYLRRNPDDAPDTNFDGYDFWLAKLNSFNGDFVRAEMVRAFISSLEYRRRFGQ